MPALQAVNITTAEVVEVPAGSPELVLAANPDSIYRKVVLCGLDRRSIAVWLGFDNTVGIEAGIPLSGDEKYEEMQQGVNAAVYQGDIFIIHRQSGTNVRVFVVEGE